VKNNWLLGNIPMNKFNKQHMINFHLTHKNESKNEDSSFERLKQDKNQLMPPSSESSAIWLTDRAVESEEFCDTGPIEYITKPQNTHKSSNNIFDRLYKESDIKMQRRAQLAQTHNKIPTKAKSKSKRCKSNKRGQFSRMKIEDKLMQRHITAKLKIDKQRKEVAMQELQYWNLRPPLSSATLEMVNNNRNLLQRQNDFIYKKKVEYEIRRKEEDDKQMEGFTGKPQINQRSRRMQKSNISQLVRSPHFQHTLMQTQRSKSTTKSHVDTVWSPKSPRSSSRSPPSVPSTPISISQVRLYI